MKIHPAGAEFFNADGRTDMTKPKPTYKTETTEILEENMGSEVMHGQCITSRTLDSLLVKRINFGGCRGEI